MCFFFFFLKFGFELKLLPRVHRITECVGLEGTFRGRLAQPPCSEQGQLQPDQVSQSPVQPGLEHFQGWGFHCLSGQPLPVFHHPHCEKLLAYIQSKSPLFQFKAITPCPITTCPCHSPSPALSQPLQALAAALRSPRSLLFMRLCWIPWVVITVQQLLQRSASAGGCFFDRSELGFYSPPVGSSTSASQSKGWPSCVRDCWLELLYELLPAGTATLRGTGMSSRML